MKKLLFFLCLVIAYNSGAQLKPVVLVRAGDSAIVFGKIVDPSGNPYGAGGGGGGGSVSSDSAAKFGIPKAVRGLIIDEPFTSLSAWTKGGGFTATASPTGVTVSGGNNTWTTHYLEYTYLNYDQMRYTTLVIPNDKTGTSYGIGYTFGQNELFYSSSATIQYKLTNDADSGTIWFNGVKLTNNLAFNTGDSLIAITDRRGWNLTFELWNKRTGKFVKGEVSTANGFGTGGKFRLVPLGGTQKIARFTAYSNTPMNPVLAFWGDSQTGGSGATNELNHWVSVVTGGNLNRVAIFGLPGVTLQYAYPSCIANIVSLHPKYCVVAGIGFNNRSQSAACSDTAIGSGNFYTIYRAIDSALTVNGITPIYTNLIPRNSAGQTPACFDIFIQNFAAAKGRKFIDVKTPLMAGGTYIDNKYISSDQVHLSNFGHRVQGNTVKAALTDSAFIDFRSDTASPLTVYELPSTTLPMNTLVVDRNGKVYRYSDPIPTPADYIQNMYQEGGGGVSSSQKRPIKPQANSAIMTSWLNGTDSIFYASGYQGLMVMYNGSVLKNIIISNEGTGGIGQPYHVPTVTGNHDIIFQTHGDGSINTTMSGSGNIVAGGAAGANMSGNGNFVMRTSNSGGTNTITSGYDNIFVSNKGGQTTGYQSIVLGKKSLDWTNATKRIHIGDGDFGEATSGQIVLTANAGGSDTVWIGSSKWAYVQTTARFNNCFNVTTNGNGGNIYWYLQGNGTGNSGEWAVFNNTPGNATQLKTFGVQNQLIYMLVPEFADNSAAISGGLTTGLVYRTGDNLKIVH